MSCCPPCCLLAIKTTASVTFFKGVLDNFQCTRFYELRLKTATGCDEKAPLVRLDIASMWPPLTRNRGCGEVVTTTVSSPEKDNRSRAWVRIHARRFFGKRTSKNARIAIAMHQKPSKNGSKSGPTPKWPHPKNGPKMIGFCTKHLGYCDKMVTKKCGLTWLGWLAGLGWLAWAGGWLKWVREFYKFA